MDRCTDRRSTYRCKSPRNSNRYWYIQDGKCTQRHWSRDRVNIEHWHDILHCQSNTCLVERDTSARFRPFACTPTGTSDVRGRSSVRETRFACARHFVRCRFVRTESVRVTSSILYLTRIRTNHIRLGTRVRVARLASAKDSIARGIVRAVGILITPTIRHPAAVYRNHPWARRCV